MNDSREVKYFVEQLKNGRLLVANEIIKNFECSAISY